MNISSLWSDAARFILANVRDHPRPDAAHFVPSEARRTKCAAGGSWVHRSVRIFGFFSLGVELGFLPLPFLAAGDLVRARLAL